MNRRDDHGGAIARSQLFDMLADTQMEPSDVSVRAGVADLKVLYQNGKISIPLLLTIQTSTGAHRGVHMSRLVHAASRTSSDSIESWLRQVCAEVNRSQPGSTVSCRFELPYADQFIPVAMRARQRGGLTYQFRVTGMTACPCSKKMIGIGHMQRAEITMVIRTRKKKIKAIETIQKLEECFSAFPTEKMKRVEEAKKILEAQENPKFAEDLLRECLRRFPDALSVEARCFESIHTHDVIASWSRKEDWVPAI
jgi:GTP cyclohydrolase FolE2